MDRELLLDETLMLLPTLMRLVERPSPVEMGEVAHGGIPEDAQVSPGHIQVLIELAEHGMVGRHQDPEDRRVVLVDYVDGMHEVARQIIDERRHHLQDALSKMTDEEALAFVKGLKLLAESFSAAEE
jgi:hypothetical protein